VVRISLLEGEKPKMSVQVNLKISHATFILIVTIWNLLAAYIGSIYISVVTPAGLALVLGIGNAVIGWLSAETGNTAPTPTPASAAALTVPSATSS